MSFWDFMSGSTPAGIISETGNKAITGVFAGVKDLISEFHLSPELEQQARLKLAEMELQSYQTRISDIQSARAMQTARPSPWPGILTLINTVGFFTTMGLVIFKGLPPTSEAGGQVILLLIGALITGYTATQAFWVGANSNSRAKDEMLANSIPISSAQSIVTK